LRNKQSADKQERNASANLQGKVIFMKTKLFLGLMLATMVFSGNIFAAPKTKVTMERAQEIALRRVSGEVEQSDTIKRHNKPTYSFFIKKSDGITTHVLVSEKGKIKRITDETPSTAKIK
jgi:uncharacterized membrane protein YkoI